MYDSNPQIAQEEIAKEWRNSAPQLMRWLNAALFHRKNVFAKYPGPVCTKDLVTASVLRRHCTGENTIGSYTTDPEDNTVIWACGDIDAHDNKADPAKNLSFALKKYQELLALGANPILEDSNGKGGYHLWVLFDRRTPAAEARNFLMWLFRDYADHGLEPVEVFPKQAVAGRPNPDLEVSTGYGNQVRLPGRHHKRDHWSRIWDGEKWLVGRQAINHMITRQKYNPELIPTEARSFIPPARESVRVQPNSWEDYQEGQDWPRNYAGDLRTLDIVALFESEGMLRHVVGGVQEVQCPWAEEHTTGTDTAGIWPAEEGRYPSYNCLHAHCSNRKLEHVLAHFGRDKVDQYCEKRFATEDKYLAQAEAKVAELFQDRPTANTAVNIQQAITEAPFNPDKYQAKPQDRKRRGYKLADLKRLPPVRYLIKEHLSTNSFGVLYGPSGGGKTFVAIEMAMSICTGRPYLGVYEVRQGPVVYMSGEGNTGIGRRFEAWCQYHKVPYPDNLLVIPYQFDLLSPAEVNEVLEIIHTDLGDKPAVVFGDTVARMFGNGDENGTKDMGAFVRGADTIRNATGAAFVGVHHTGKDVLRGERGNSALRAASDTMISVDDTDGGKGSLIACTKQKESDQFDGYIVKRRVVDLGQDDEGEDINSCVLIPQEQGRTKYQLLPKKKKDQLSALWAKFGANSFGPTEAAEPLGVTKSTAGETLKYLAGKGTLDTANGRYTVASTVRSVIMAG